jgi:succinoglycan biosynthesis transport protein ExoP
VAASYDLSLQDYLRVLRRRWKVVAASCVLLGGLTLALTPAPHTTYEASARVKWTRTDSVAGLFLESFSWSPGDDLATQAQIIRSKPVALRAAQHLGRIDPSLSLDQVLQDRAMSARLDQVIASYTARPIDNTSLIEIRSACASPEEAIKVADAVVAEYIALHTLERNRQAIEARKFVEQQVAEVGDRLTASEERLAAFKEENVGARNPDAKEIQFFQDEAARTEAQVVSLGSLVDVLAAPRPDGAAPDLLLADIPQEGLGELRDELMKLEDRRRSLETYMKDDAPEVAKVRGQIDVLTGRLLREARTALDLARTRKAALDTTLARYPRTEQRLMQLQRDVQVNAESYEMLMKKRQEALIREADKVTELSIVETATHAEVRHEPGRALRALIGLLVGLLLGLVGAFASESLDTSIGTIEDVEQYLQQPVIGVVPHIDTDAIRREIVERHPALAGDRGLDGLAGLVTQFAPQSPVAEAFRSLRTNLEFSRLGKTGRTFLFTSATPCEGKSTTVANLGVAMAQMGLRTLVWDCDLRSPSLGRMFGVPREPGFTHALLGMARLEDVVHRCSDALLGRVDLRAMLTASGLENLHILTAGALPPNPSELLSSPLFGDFAGEVASRFDVVLVDAPPVLPVTDAAILATRVDGVILVYQLGRVGRAALRRAKVHLDTVRATVCGIVLNDVRAAVSSYTPEMQYIQKAYAGAARRRAADGPRPVPDRAAAASVRR